MTRPHILLITLDECRADALGCYGGRVVATPAIDRLARQGTLFRQAFAPSPLCLPSRYSLITGLYPQRHGAYSNFRRIVLDPASPNLYRTLAASGYRTAHVGKCHYAPVAYGRRPSDPGYQDWPLARATALGLGVQELHLCEGKQAAPDWPDDYTAAVQAAGVAEAYDGLWQATRHTTQSFPFPGPEQWHADVWTAQQAIGVVRRQQRQKPLFLWCSFPGPHYPHDPPARYLERVDHSLLPLLRYTEGEFAAGDKIQGPAYLGTTFYGLVEGAHRPGGTASLSDADWRVVQSHYFAGIALLDDWIGQLVEAAERTLGDELLVVLSADHGDCMGAHRLWGKNRCAYDEVLRIPLVVRGPGFPAATISDARASLIDLVPTLHGAAGIDAPAAAVDGRPLRGSLADGGHALLLASNETFLAIHDARWKLIIDRASGLSELYDRQQDPGEVVNRIHDPSCQGERQRLAAAALGSFLDSALR
jgi:arylsulfatase